MKYVIYIKYIVYYICNKYNILYICIKYNILYIKYIISILYYIYILYYMLYIYIYYFSILYVDICVCVLLISHMITQVWTLSEKEDFHQLTGAARKQKRKVEFCPAAICPQFMKCTANLFMKFLYDMSMKCSKAKTTNSWAHHCAVISVWRLSSCSTLWRATFFCHGLHGGAIGKDFVGNAIVNV